MLSRQIDVFRGGSEIAQNAEICESDLRRSREAIAIASPGILASTDMLSVDRNFLRHAVQR